MRLNATAFQQILKLSIEEEAIYSQLEIFKKGTKPIKLIAPSTLGNGIMALSPKEKTKWMHYFEANKHQYTFLKFVPASGASSRMFQNLFVFLKEMNPNKELFEDYLQRTKDDFMRRFGENITKFAFYPYIKTLLAKQKKPFSVYNFVSELLFGENTDFASKPKGILPFHKYKTTTQTPVEAHLLEAVEYSNNKGVVSVHFTIFEEHKKWFQAILKKKGPIIEKKHTVSLAVDFSFQKPNTHTIAVNLDNTPFQCSDGSLLFRPSGHGALIENLNEIDADIIFIKNIDNVAIGKYQKEIIDAKKMLAGILMYVQSYFFECCRKLEGEMTASEIKEIIYFLTQELESFKNIPSLLQLPLKQQQQELRFLLDRPIRVCGMVKNNKAIGGGPFWVQDNTGRETLQIVEMAQIEIKNKKQKTILESATHFNPVDIVCGIKNYKGNKFDLRNFVDHSQVFITEKTKEDKKIKVLERPGLWNGAMAHWNTIFVEVPSLTFNPVKTVNDLLQPAHLQDMFLSDNPKK